MSLQTFKVNEYITLKLERGKTNIYVNGEIFNQCMLVLISRHVEEIEDLFALDSIDELAENYGENGELKSIKIPIETQFWVHCSNLQVWVENNYDTRLLHSYLSFPLLKRLAETGDSHAKLIFKEEIIKRIKIGSYSTQKYLVNERYLSYLTEDELIEGILDLHEFNIMSEIISISHLKYRFTVSFDEDEVRHKYDNSILYFAVSNGHIVNLELQIDKASTHLLPLIKGLKNLKVLYVYVNNVESLDFWISHSSLLVLKLYFQKDTIITNFGGFQILRTLIINGMDWDKEPLLKNLDILSMENLKKINIQNIKVEKWPDDIDLLKNLEECEIHYPLD